MTAPVALAGVPQFTVSPGSHGFGDVEVGGQSDVMSSSVTNVSGAGVTFTNLDVTFSDPRFDWISNCNQGGLAAGASCAIGFLFIPTAPGTVTATATVNINGQDFPVTLTGCGVQSGGACPPPTTTTTTTTTIAGPQEPGPGTPTTTEPGQPGGPGDATTTTTSWTTTTTASSGPSAAVALSVVARGQTQTGTGSGFQPGEAVTAVQQSTELNLGSQVADADGNVTITWTIRADESPGTHTFIVTGAQSGSASATFTVPGGSLPATGSGTTEAAVTAAVLLAGGVALSLLTIRRRNRPT